MHMSNTLHLGTLINDDVYYLMVRSLNVGGLIEGCLLV